MIAQFQDDWLEKLAEHEEEIAKAQHEFATVVQKATQLKSDQDRWWEAYNTALNGFLSNAKLNDEFAHEDDGYPESCAVKSADRSLKAFNKRFNKTEER